MKFWITQVMICVVMLGLCACGDDGSGSDSGAVTTANLTGTVTIASLALQATASGNVSAQATASGTVPVPGAVCTVEGTDKSGTADDNGLFAIHGVTPGSHILICKKTDPAGNAYAFLQAVEVLGGQTLNLGELEITRAGKIQGVATLSGQPDSTGVRVYIPGTSLQATTDATGAYLLNDVPAGTHELRLESSGYMTATLTGIRVPPGQIESPSDVELNISAGTTGSIMMANGTPYATSRTVPLAISASTNATLMQLSEEPNFVGAAWRPIATSAEHTFATDGPKRLYIKFADANGLESAPVSDEIIVDTTPPAIGAVIINAGAATTNSTTVTLTLAALDATTSVSQMMLSDSPEFTDAIWETFSATRSWSLSAGDGSKLVYAKYKDLLGNETTAAVSAPIRLDTTSPTSASGSIDEGAYTKASLIHLTLAATDAAYMKVSEDPDFAGVDPVPYATATTFLLSAGDGTKTIYVRYLDAAGNAADVPLSPITLDTTPPTTPVIFNQNQTTNQATFTVTLSTPSSDDHFKTYVVKGGQYATWTVTKETGPFNFTLSQTGPNYLSIVGKDRAGNVSRAASVVVTLDTTAPVLSNIAVVAKGKSATVSWTSSEMSTGAVEYGLNSTFGSSQTDTTVRTAHFVTLPDLSELTTYTYRITATDAGGNVTTSTDLTFTTGREVSGNLLEDTTWLAAGGPYIITGTVGVVTGVTLTIEPGTVIKYAGAYTILVKGAIIANGTDPAPITFTVLDGIAAAGVTQITFTQTNLLNSQLSHVLMENAGSTISTTQSTENRLYVSYANLFNTKISTSRVEFSNSKIDNTIIDLNNFSIRIIDSAVNNTNFVKDYIYYSGYYYIQRSVVTDSNIIGRGAITESTLTNSTIKFESGSISKSQLYNSPIEARGPSRVNIEDTFITFNGGSAIDCNTDDSSPSECNIIHSEIIGNNSGIGVNTYKGATISYSTIKNTEIAVLIKRKISESWYTPTKIYNSNFIDNRLYNVRNATTMTIEASNNYWNTTDTSTINDMIFDASDNPLYYGPVNYSPFLTEPQLGAGPR